MQERSLGKTEIRLSEVSLGTWGLASCAYGPVSESAFDKVVGSAIDAGITTFDMAPSWGLEEASERAVARVGGYRRHMLRYITRAGVRVTDGQISRDYSPEALRADCEASLSRLGTDRIDVWLLHDPPERSTRRTACDASSRRSWKRGKSSRGGPR